MPPYRQKMQRSGCVCWVSATLMQKYLWLIQFTVDTFLNNMLNIFTLLDCAPYFLL